VHLSALAIGAAVLNVVLNFALIPPFGIVGAGLLGRIEKPQLSLEPTGLNT